MKFYVSKCHDTLNGKEYSPETITPYLCLNPYYNATLKKHSKVNYILDSGAFQDVKTENRLGTCAGVCQTNRCAGQQHVPQFAADPPAGVNAAVTGRRGRVLQGRTAKREYPNHWVRNTLKRR